MHLYTYIYVPVGIEVYMVLSDTLKQNKTATGKWYPAAQVIFMYSFSSGPNEFGFAWPEGGDTYLPPGGRSCVGQEKKYIFV